MLGPTRDLQQSGSAARHSVLASKRNYKDIVLTGPNRLGQCTMDASAHQIGSDPSAHGSADNDSTHLHLHYTRPSTKWSEALPVGNGRLGAMVHGRVTTELLQLNEDSVWYGGPQDRTPRDAHENLPLLRQLIREGRHAEAERLVQTAFFSTPASMRHYEPLGNCTIDFDHGDLLDASVSQDQAGVTSYRRWLDLSESICETEYKFRQCNQAGIEENEPVKVRRQVIASFPDRTLLTRITSSSKIKFTLRLNRVSEIEWETNEFLDSIHTANDRITLQATPGGKDSNRLALVLGVHCDDIQDGGFVKSVGNCLIVESTTCTIAIGAQTTYRVEDPAKIAMHDVEQALQRSWENLLARHVADYKKLFNRVSLRMWPDAKHVSTDERLRNNRDPGLVALYHNLGRYLLISCSRDSYKPLPANLQGIWNPSFAPAWGSKYTININIQMNYWPMSASNLFECALPLVDLLERMAERGKTTAQTVYGCKGWCAHHNTDIWADTDPQDRWMPATLWPLAGVWICVDMVKLVREQYDQDLHRRLAPILEGCIEFLLDFLVPSKCDQYLVTNPSLSPENTFLSNGNPGIFCEGSTMDMSIVDMAFEYFLWTVDKVYEGNHPLAERVEAARLPPLRINDRGLIQEWGMQDYDEFEPGHRHVSHLFGLYPGNTIKSDEEVKAARRVLNRRAAHGGGHTGWSRAWLMNLHARLRDAEGSGKHMDLLLRDSTLPNMLDSHPPFQIDGNFGGCAGVVECLARRWEPTLYEAGVTLLPACPKRWASGQLVGLHVRDGWTVSFEWKEGNIVDPVIARSGAGADKSSSLAVKYPDRRIAIVRGPGEHRVVHDDATMEEGECGDMK